MTGLPGFRHPAKRSIMITAIERTTQTDALPDWRQSLRDAVTDPSELLALVGLSHLADRLPDNDAGFPLKVPRGFIARMRQGDPHDPLLLQVLPQLVELNDVPGFVDDAVGDLDALAGHGVLHKYAGRALLIAAGSCAVNCRYCFRRHFPYAEELAASHACREALACLAADTSIREVILSGGDPLVLSTQKLTELTEAAQQELRQAITRGTYIPGSQLPTEEELGALLGVSRTVVREALRVLEDDGLITRRHGVGTFVRTRPILKNLNFNFGITEMIESAGLKPGTSHMAIHREAATEEIASQLNIAIGAELITIERVRTAGDRPVVYSLDTFPEALVRADDFDPNRLLKESLYQILQTDFGHVIEYGVAQSLPASASALIAERLAIPKGSQIGRAHV